jgi:hypothetical protein
MLEAAVGAVLARSDAELAPEPVSLVDAAHQALDQMDELKDLTRLVLRDLDQFPDVLTPVVDRLLEGPVRLVAERTVKVAPTVDAEAIAAVLVGGLVNFKVIEALAGRRPGAVPQERIVAAWAQLYRLVLENHGEWA